MRIQIEDPSRGRSVMVFKGPKVVIGRHEDCDLVIHDGMASKVHAEIIAEGEKHVLRDKGSSNGTFLNGQMVADIPIAPGDRIRIGKTEIVFLSGGGDETAGTKAAAPPRKAAASPPPGDSGPARGPGLAGAATVRLGPKTSPAIPAADPGPARTPGRAPSPAISPVPVPAPAPRPVSPPEPAPAPRAAARGTGKAVPILGGAVAVLALAVAALLLFPRGSREEKGGKTDGGETAAAVEAVLLPSSPAAGSGGGPAGSSAPGGAPAGTPGLAALFAERAEYILLARCGRCHDGSRGTSFLLRDEPAGDLRSSLNLAGLRPFLDPRSPGESELLRKGTGKVPHGGGAAASPDEAARIAAFLAEAAGKLERGASFLFPAKPPYPGAPAGVPPEKEVLARRVFLDLLGRPPTRAELEAAGPRPIREVLEGLVGGDEYRDLWKEDAAGPIRDAWGEKDLPPIPRSEVVVRLASLYGARLEGRSPRRKTAARLVRSLAVDLRDRVPDIEEAGALEAALEAADGETLPLAAFLLGEVEAPPDREAWIDGLYARFLLRRPEAAERTAALAILEGKGGARILVLGLASSPGYRMD